MRNMSDLKLTILVATLLNFLLKEAAALSHIPITRSFTSKHGLTPAISEPVIPRWPTPIIESDGDYTGENFLEEHIDGPLYSIQKNLPRLPVPSISDTLKVFLPTALPLAESKEEEDALIEACDAFAQESEMLQKRLEARANELGESSWLQAWWNQRYLQLREPIVINLSYFLPLKNDETLPSSSMQSMCVLRAACAAYALAEYRKKVCSGQLPVERYGSKEIPLCSSSFKYHLHSCRIPMENQDVFRMYDPSIFKHCVVACRGQFFAMDIVNENDDPLPFKVIQNGLEQCINLASQTPMSIPQLGFLTTTNRDVWAQNRELIIEAGGEEVMKSLEKIESSMALICLDETTSCELEHCVPSFWYGGLGQYMNRWFDKPIQLLCQRSGSLAYMGEHSMLDGMPASRLCDHIVDSKYEKLVKRSSDETGVPVIEDIFKNSNDRLLAHDRIAFAIEKAKSDLQNLVIDQNMTIKVYAEYGMNYLKENALSGDAFVQMAMQLAAYRLFGKQVATYESAHIRSFLHGRTETIRSVSPQSHNFLERMGRSPEINPSPRTCDDKMSLLKAAMWAHSKYLNKASKGHGCDRHFLGLSMLLEERHAPPSLFQDPVFKRSQHWRLSTSTLRHVPGFGCAVDDGIGVGYNVDPDSITFIVSSRSNGLNWTEKFIKLVEESLLELKILVDRSN